MFKKIAILLLFMFSGFFQQALSETESLSFFVTSVGVGNGANLGGLAGADAHCNHLAALVGADNRVWKAYLSTVEDKSQPQVNARDRIGSGPWYNAKGVLVAKNVEDLHTNNKLNKKNSITEKGTVINGRGDKPNKHDILTGSSSDGMALSGEDDTTCNNWNSNDKGSALVGHHDRKGGNNRTSWNSSHSSFGCSAKKLRMTGGNGLFYCFAADKAGN